MPTSEKTSRLIVKHRADAGVSGPTAYVVRYVRVRS